MNRRTLVLAAAFVLSTHGIALGASKAEEADRSTQGGAGGTGRGLQGRAIGAQGRRVRGGLCRVQQLRHEDPRGRRRHGQGHRRQQQDEARPS